MKLTSQYRELDQKLQVAKEKLETKLRGPIQEFLDETAVPISSIYPSCENVTALGDPEESFVIGEIKIHTDRDPR